MMNAILFNEYLGLRHKSVGFDSRHSLCFCQWFIGIGGLLGIAFCVMRQTGHKNPATVETYAREKNSLMNNAVANIGL